MSDAKARLAELAAARWRLAVLLTATMTIVYVGFILLVAFGKPLLGRVLMPGLSVGILLGVLVIAVAWAIIVVYVQDDEPRATQYRYRERMRECALAGRREVRRVNDRLDKRWNGVCGYRHVETRFRCPDCRSEPQDHATRHVRSSDVAAGSTAPGRP